MAGKNIYFISDFHLGAPDAEKSLQREKKIIRFLNEIEQDAAAVFLLGDMFDFWFEYKYVVPKGYTRLLGKLAHMSDAGIKLHFFVGNHDMWMKDYFTHEIGMQVYHHPQEFHFSGKRFLIGHGDGLGPGDEGYKRLKKFFRHPVSQWGFSVLPPAVGMGLANYFSRKSRAQTGMHDEVFHGEEKEMLLQYCKYKLQQSHYDFFIFGHRHLTLNIDLGNNSRYINTGDWIRYNSYAMFDGNTVQLLTYNG